MARGRMLSAYVALSETMADLPDDTCRLLATWMIPHLDRDGRITGSPRRLQAIVVPLLRHLEVEDVKRCVEAICAGPNPLAVLYRDTSGLPVLQFTKFAEYQVGMKYDRESPSRFGPPPERSGSPPESSCSPPESSASRARARALTSLPFSSLGSPDPDARATTPTPAERWKPPPGTGAALAALFPELRDDIDGQLDFWADAHPGLDFVQIAKEVRAKLGKKRVDDARAYLSGCFSRAWAKRQADNSAAFEADHKKRKAAEAEEARLLRAITPPKNPVPLAQLTAGLMGALQKGEK